MTNLERWQSYTSGLSSPQNYIDWGFRYLIGASLQRRVWIGSPYTDAAEEYQPCFPNTYQILVGPPGTGKGLVIKAVAGFMRHWKLKDALKVNGEAVKVAPEIQQTIDSIHESNLKDAQSLELQCRNKQNKIVEPLLLPLAADAITYEALVEAIAQSHRRINFIKPDGRLGIYGHSSLCFCLEELSSLLRKRTNDTVNYLLALYDCPLDYEYKTKTQGVDRVRRGCLNLIAGTTPNFMKTCFDEGLTEQGFSSRVFFICAQDNRKDQFFIPPLTQEQIQHRNEILEHIRKLASLYGCIKVSKETHEFLEDWIKTYKKDKASRVNKSPELESYYARKNIHMMKVAIAEHFADNLTMEIPLETYKKAAVILSEEEKNMHLAITLEGKNPLSGITKKLLEMLTEGPRDFVSMHVDTFNLADRNQLEESLQFLEETDQVVRSMKKNEITGKDIVIWQKKK